MFIKYIKCRYTRRYENVDCFSTWGDHEADSQSKEWSILSHVQKKAYTLVSRTGGDLGYFSNLWYCETISHVLASTQSERKPLASPAAEELKTYFMNHHGETWECWVMWWLYHLGHPQGAVLGPKYFIYPWDVEARKYDGFVWILRFSLLWCVLVLRSVCYLDILFQVFLIFWTPLERLLIFLNLNFVSSWNEITYLKMSYSTSMTYLSWRK
jgi:hypothetical protein